jgi:predicted DCC family thiol-disulfide oxidoreductase YuxK
VELRFVPMNSAEAQRRFPGIEKHRFGEDLVVISDEGAAYCGPSAYLMCLYALVEYREWAQRLASPALLPLARRVFHLLSDQRLRLSRWFFSGNAKDIERRLGPEGPTACERLAVHGDLQIRQSARRT